MSAKKALRYQLAPVYVRGRLPPLLEKVKVKSKDPSIGSQERNFGVRVGIQRVELFSSWFLNLDGIVHG
jgi:hypothetical protein